ncbi:hypothetical protein RRSWK_06767 [Rhodopirellula sp. SWK7]|nr:hypothetical protein RRSWK_06767 [Rhodopirellula sp. SWK7]
MGDSHWKCESVRLHFSMQLSRTSPSVLEEHVVVESDGTCVWLDGVLSADVPIEH